ncbi:MAG: ribosome small subunit-dependent GTPase A [Caulobacteraceae bacterium]
MLELYGWSGTLQREFAPHRDANLSPGRVIARHRGLWMLATEAGEIAAEITGRLGRDALAADLPAVGDWTAVKILAPPARSVISAVMPRHSTFTRRAAGPAGGVQVIAANIDLALLASSLNAEFNPRRLERWLTLVWSSGAAPIVLLTKSDLVGDVGPFVDAARRLAGGASVLTVSAISGAGVEAVRERLAPGLTGCLIGSSGVGKSTLVNALVGEARMAVQEIRADDEHGRHTTTHRELIPLSGGGLLIDTPGMREAGLLDSEEGIETAFSDIETLARRCRFRDCAHRAEPGCAVRQALREGELDEGRWRSFLKLEKEAAFAAAKEDVQLRLERRRQWIGIAKANRRRGRLERGEDL